jgi:ribulose 1,5-bisphosphate synthetase/thiazole synthase
MLSIGGALVVSGVVLSRVEATIAAQAEVFRQEHEELAKHTDQLISDVRTLATEEAAQQLQLTTLHDSILQERNDRLAGETRWRGGR